MNELIGEALVLKTSRLSTKHFSLNKDGGYAKIPPPWLVGYLKVSIFQTRLFLEAKLDNYPSWIWKSLLHRRSLLDYGVKWKFGNEKQFDHTSDNWLFQGSPQKPLLLEKAPRPIPSLDFFHDHGIWNSQKLHQYYLVDSVYLIQKILIPSSSIPDKLVWSLTNFFIFSVKSAYHQAIEISQLESTS
ncbi:hypothetical protein LINGRAHAP2_LOCUS7669 [Linum grandiflorum]